MKGTIGQRLRHVPVRMCVACRARRPKAELLRLSLTPDGRLVVGGESGRGAYLCRQEACVERGMSPSRLGGALRARLDQGMVRRAKIEIGSVLHV